MLSQTPQSVAIIGAGIAGYILALTLRSHNIPFTIYELRQRDEHGHVGGAIMTSPNALRILDKLGLYDTLRTKGFNFDESYFYTEDHRVLDTYWFGNEELYGYRGLRIYRSILLDTLRTAAEERGVQIIYGKSFASIVSDDVETGVEFAFKDGTHAHADLLVGADGIHSKVRGSMYGAQAPQTQFMGFIGVTSAVPRASLRLPTPDYAMPATVLTKKGNFVLAPQDTDGSEIFIGRQLRTHDRDRKGWDELVADKEQLLAMIKADADAFPDLAQSALESVVEEKLNIWPFYSVPELDSWTSATQRIILVGDAAHALPPTTGGGANQAFEDSYTLGKLLANLSPEWTLEKVMPLWFQNRSGRVNGLRKLTRMIDNRRLPLDEQAKLPEGEVYHGEGPSQNAWLYAPEVGEQCLEYVRQGLLSA